MAIVILGDFLTEILAEHEITPIVKIIDFGSAGQMTRNNHHQEVQDRRSMAMVITCSIPMNIVMTLRRRLTGFTDYGKINHAIRASWYAAEGCDQTRYRI